MIKLTKKYQKFFTSVSSKDNKELLKKHLSGMDNETLSSLNQDDIEKIILNIFKNSSTKVIHHYDNVNFLGSKDKPIQGDGNRSNESTMNNNKDHVDSIILDSDKNDKHQRDKTKGIDSNSIVDCNLFQNEMFIKNIMKDDSTKPVNKKIEELKTLSNISLTF